MDNQYDETSSENWDWEEPHCEPPKPLTARQRFEQVLSNQKDRFVEPFIENPLFDKTKHAPPTPPPPQFDEKFDFSENYAEWIPYEPSYEPTSEDSTYEVISETEDSTYESESESFDEVMQDQIIQELKNLRSNLARIEDRCTLVAVEQEMLVSQLEDCEDMYDRLLDEADQLEDAIDEKLDELETFEVEYIKTQAARVQHEKENKLMSLLIEDIDEFSQSTQLLLNNALYFDMEDLIMKHIKKCESDDPAKVKKSIIAEANIIRKEQLKSAVQALDCYLVDRSGGKALNFEFKH